MTPPPSRRIFARYPCDLAVVVYAENGRPRIDEGRFFNIGMGGAALQTYAVLEKDASYKFNIKEGFSELELSGKIVRVEAAANTKLKHSRYGINFKLNGRQEEILKVRIDKIRQAQPENPMERKMKGYWGV